MSSIFNYNTFDVRLEKATRTLWVSFNNPPVNYLSREFLFEFESLLAWCTGKVEIHSIVLQSRKDRFSEGIDPEVLKKLNSEKLDSFTEKLQKINFSLMHLPQIIIADIGMGCRNIASELVTACDIRIAHRACSISYDHASLGFMPSSGGISQLSLVAGHANARNWLLSGSQIKLQKLETSGFLYASYRTEERHELIETLLNDIHNQAPVQRIQTKMGVIENIRTMVESLNQIERKLSKAASTAEDWKEKEVKDSIPAKNMKQAVKLSLIKNEEGPLN